MALNPSIRYPVQTDSALGYPNGKARNAVTFGDGTGTPLERDWVNDLWGFLQALLSNAGLVPSGTPDQVGASQYLAGVTFIAQQKADGAQAAAVAAAIAAAAITAASLSTAAAASAEKRLALSNWSDVQTIALFSAMRALIWSPSFSSFLAGAGAADRFAYSFDGFTWLVSTNTMGANVGDFADNGAGVAIAVGTGGVLKRSTDGAAWSVQTSGSAQDLAGATWHINRFVVAGSTGTILTSPDGIVWTTRTSTTTEHLSSIASSGAILVAVGTNGKIITSPDGTTWTARTSGTVQNLSDVAWNGSLFLACGGTAVLTSPDGITWTPRVPGLLTSHQQVGAADNLFCLTGLNSGVSILIVSSDGIAWKTIPPTLGGMKQFVGAGSALPFAWSGTIGIIGGTTSAAPSYVRSLARIAF